MEMPTRIVDLHTHLFNARYLPLASIIAHAMKKDESYLANVVAKLLEKLTGSSYEPPTPSVLPSHAIQGELNEYYLEQIWQTTRYQLNSYIGSLSNFNFGVVSLDEEQFSSSTLQALLDTELTQIIDQLSHVDYAAEGWTGTVPDDEEALMTQDLGLMQVERIEDFINIAKRTVKKALRVVAALMDPKAWGKIENYLEFFLNMLRSERKIITRLFESYGSGLPPLQVVHLMMDMQMAYAGEKSPYYPFFPRQLENMEQLHHENQARLFGFSAFDPRRRLDWKKQADVALAKGFRGFKFYPAMGYQPAGNSSELQSVIDAFFDYCVAKNVPIFTHCTPEGFQTRHKKGYFAHPKHWRTVLENPRWSNLRLCLGHAGGGRIQSGPITSAGWMARNDEEWRHDDNFARIVTELCTTYPNVYCELGHIHELFEDRGYLNFTENLERAINASSNKPNQFALLDKIAYGTDWHMPNMIGSTRQYLEIFLRIMNKSEYKKYLQNFFWRNAYRYLKLPQ